MIPELGLFSLVLALLFALLLTVIPTIGLWRNNAKMQATTTHYVGAQFGAIVLSYLALTYSFLTNDFSVHYVFQNSSIALPWFYKACAVWGGHEGSMLLWILILSFWMVLVSLFSRSLPALLRVRVLVVLGMMSVGFILFLLTTSNPFMRQFEMLGQTGRDLNPLLQDPGFLFHPPMLYMGYVGFSVAFAFAIAVLWMGRMDSSWAKWTRPWTLAAWCCLTLGITLGSWWAYRELGWGGWWFWDPVENASFMPWLVGTALIHSLAMNEQREELKAWTLLLAITAFSLSLIGTFLVRSGVLISVHAFAVDPARGLYILMFLLTVIGGALLLFAARAKTLYSPRKAHWFSREGALLLNNLFLWVAMLTVLMGTLYPLCIDALGLGKLSVGAPYFNAVFVPLMIPCLLVMGLGLHLRWQRAHWSEVWHRLRIPMMISLIIPWIWYESRIVVLGLTLAFWVGSSTLLAFYYRVKQRGILGVGQSFLGMVIAHLGVVVTVIGISVSQGFGHEEDIKLLPGQQMSFSGYALEFVSEASLTGPNYHGTKTCFKLTKNGQDTLIYPEKRIYDAGHMPMTEAAIDATFFRDIYVALGEPLGEEAWSIRLYYKPFVRWIWGGGLLMVLGGVISLFQRRYMSVQS